MHSNYSLSLKLMASLLSVLVLACSAPTKTEVMFENGAKSLQLTHDAIVLFPTYHDRAGVGDAGFIRCLKTNIEKQFSNRMRIIDTELFQDYMFPWFEPESAPSTIKDLNAMLSQKIVRDRIASLGVRYLINIATSSKSDGFPGIFCGGGFGAAGCLGVLWEDNTYHVYAVIFDIVKGIKSGTLSAKTAGKSFGFAFVIPILFMADTEKGACKELAAEIGHLLNDATDAKSVPERHTPNLLNYN